MTNVMYGGGAQGVAASCSGGVFMQEGPVHFIKLMHHEEGDLSEDISRKLKPGHKWIFLELVPV